MGKKLYRRERYLEKIRPFYNDDGIIKVITGARRCGKSCLMATVAEELVESGAPGRAQPLSTSIPESTAALQLRHSSNRRSTRLPVMVARSIRSLMRCRT